MRQGRSGWSRWVQILAGLVVPMLVTEVAHGVTRYVAPNGRASQAGSKDSPWDLATAASNAKAGDVVELADGVYAGQFLCLSRSGTAVRPITFRAADGAVPVLEGGPGNARAGIDASTVVHDIVLEGLWLRQWRYSGVAISWSHHGASGITVRHCVADDNQQAGISLYWARRITIEENISSRNGWGPDSWSSCNFDIFAPQGGDNAIRGNVAFHGIDTSAASSDGNGFILDLSIDKGSALFENNLGFLNGGACISVTDSRGARLVNNTCFHNAQRTAAEFEFDDTCRAVVEGIPVNGNDYVLHDALFANNVAVGDTGKRTFAKHTCKAKSTAWVTSAVQGNIFVTGDGTAEFADPGARDFRLKADSSLVGQAPSIGTPARDIGFDPRCIKAQSAQRYPFWTNAPDETYIRSIGGIAKCWSPVARPQGAKCWSPVWGTKEGWPSPALGWQQW